MPPTEFWVGLSDLAVEGEYRWTDGKLLGSVQWRSAPNNQNGADCIDLTSAGLTDTICSKELYFICEVEGRLVIVNPY